MLRNFAGASRRVGQGQLQKLRPLRDQRFVQRYLAAVDAGEAQGWHTLVFGLTLAVYSLPLRQGLFSYAHQATRGFLYAAADTLILTESRGAARALFDELCAGVPAAVEAPLALWPGGRIVVPFVLAGISVVRTTGSVSHASVCTA